VLLVSRDVCVGQLDIMEVMVNSDVLFINGP